MSRQCKLKYQELPLDMQPVLHVGSDTLTGRCRRARDREPATPLLHFHTTYMYNKFVNAFTLNRAAYLMGVFVFQLALSGHADRNVALSLTVI